MMNSAGQASEGSASVLATARYDRESAGAAGAENLIRIARQFRRAMILKIPIGYEDDTGFHRGEPQAQPAAPPAERDEV